jgi:serine/threonine protein phosphatase 1
VATYAIPDLHGRYDLLCDALDRILAQAGAPGLVVTLGDYVDRGPDSRRVVERVMDPGLPAGWRLLALSGNHEDMMLRTCREPLEPGWWLRNGGGATLVSYGQRWGEAPDPRVVPAAHLDWMENLPLMHVDRHRVFVHGGVDPALPLERQAPEVLAWKRYPDDDEGGHGARHVVHGHQPIEDGPLLRRGRTDLDTLAWATGRLVIGVFDDDAPGGPVELIEIRRDPYP